MPPRGTYAANGDPRRALSSSLRRARGSIGSGASVEGLLISIGSGVGRRAVDGRRLRRVDVLISRSHLQVSAVCVLQAQIQAELADRRIDANKFSLCVSVCVCSTPTFPFGLRRSTTKTTNSGAARPFAINLCSCALLCTSEFPSHQIQHMRTLSLSKCKWSRGS